MRHEMLTQRARFCIGVMAKKGTLSQHFVTHVVPPLGRTGGRHDLIERGRTQQPHPLQLTVKLGGRQAWSF